MRMKGTGMPRLASILLLVSAVALAAASQEVELDDRLSAMAASEAEYAAVQALDIEESPVNRLTMTDAFLAEYPESEMRHQVLLMRLQTYVDLENNQGDTGQW